RHRRCKLWVYLAEDPSEFPEPRTTFPQLLSEVLPRHGFHPRREGIHRTAQAAWPGRGMRHSSLPVWLGDNEQKRRGPYLQPKCPARAEDVGRRPAWQHEEQRRWHARVARFPGRIRRRAARHNAVLSHSAAP